LWGILFALTRFTKEYQITQGHETVACDGIAALGKAKKEAITESKEKHYDLISALRQMRRLLPITLGFKHVKGHQDSGLMMVLTREAWMNIEMDKVAKSKVSTDGPLQQLYSIPYEGWICYLEGMRVIKNLMETLCKHVKGPIL